LEDPQQIAILQRLPSGLIQQLCSPVEVANLDFYIDPSNRKNQDTQSTSERDEPVSAAVGPARTSR